MPAIACPARDSFAFAVSQSGVEDAGFWASKASDYLRAYFHAAALARLDLTAVARRVTGLDPTEAEAILAAAGTATGGSGPASSPNFAGTPTRRRRQSG